MFNDKKNLLTILFAILTFATVFYVFAAGNSEFQQTIMLAQCSDSIDNDGDDFVDFPADPGCSSVYDNDESNTLNTVPGQSTGVPVNWFNASVGSASITGLAAPGATVILRKNNIFFGITKADEIGRFSFLFNNLELGENTFLLDYEDAEKNHSSIVVVPVNIRPIVELNLFLPPIIKPIKDEFNIDEPVIIFGKSVPNADIILIVRSENELIYKSVVDSFGAYVFEIPAAALEPGVHLAEAKAVINGQESFYSRAVGFAVKGKTDQPVSQDSESEVVAKEVVPKKVAVKIETPVSENRVGDTEKPEYVRLKDVLDSNISSERQKILIEAHDRTSGLDQFEIKIDDGPIQRLPAADSLIYTTLPLNPGLHKITVTAIDRSGNSLEATHEFVIQGNQPIRAAQLSVWQTIVQTASVHRCWLWLFLILYLLTFAGTAVYLLFR